MFLAPAYSKRRWEQLADLLSAVQNRTQIRFRSFIKERDTDYVSVKTTTYGCYGLLGYGKGGERASYLPYMVDEIEWTRKYWKITLSFHSQILYLIEAYFTSFSSRFHRSQDIFPFVCLNQCYTSLTTLSLVDQSVRRMYWVWSYCFAVNLPNSWISNDCNEGTGKEHIILWSRQ